jgi:hypothetical protein
MDWCRRRGRCSPALRLVDPSLARPHEPVAIVHGVNAHAAVRVHGNQRAQEERLCRYLGRPPIAEERLTRTETGDGSNPICPVSNSRRPSRNTTRTSPAKPWACAGGRERRAQAPGTGAHERQRTQPQSFSRRVRRATPPRQERKMVERISLCRRSRRGSAVGR